MWTELWNPQLFMKEGEKFLFIIIKVNHIPFTILLHLSPKIISPFLTPPKIKVTTKMLTNKIYTKQ